MILSQAREAFMTVRRVPIDDVLRLLKQAGTGRSVIAGFAIIANPVQSPPPLRAITMVNDFIGPFGERLAGGQGPGAEWAGILPEGHALSTWAAYSDERGCCLLEGEFYSPAWGRGGTADAALAHLVFERVLDVGPPALDALNGLFSGAVYAHCERRLWLFVDRLGTRFLYYWAHPDRCEAATNLYGFRHACPPPRLDAQALNEHLVLGSPTRSKTLFDGIRLVPPGTAVEWSEHGVREERYYHYPTRLSRQSAVDGAAMICGALDRHVGALSLSAEPSIALSAGKDSRVVLGALLRSGYRPTVSTFTVDPDLPYVLRLAEAAGLDAYVVDEREHAAVFDWDSALLQDGYSAGTSFLAMAAETGLRSGTLFTGFAGDVLSGAWAGLRPWRLATVEALATEEYRRHGPAIPPDLVSRILRPEFVRPFDDVREAFLDSFRQEHDGDLVTTYLRHRISHRNRRRVAPVFRLMSVCTTIVQPFADHFVLDAYLSLPVASLFAQAAHRLAATHGVPVLGSVSVGRSLLPLRYETEVAQWIERIREAGRRLPRRPRSRSRRRLRSPRHRQHLAMAAEVGLFDPSILGFIELPQGTIIKLGATALHVAVMLGRSLPSAPTPKLLPR
jgi:hypothetical protein